jgi:cell division transport system permease protein
MSQLGAKYSKRGLQTSYVSTVVGISLVLTMLGVVLTIILGLTGLKQQVKEQIQVDLFFSAEFAQEDIKLIAAQLQQHPGIRSAEFISSERAWEEFEKITLATGDSLQNAGFDLSVIDGEIPIPPSISFHPKADYANEDSMNVLQAALMTTYPAITDFNLNRESLQDVNLGFDRIAYIILVIAALLLLIAFAMINNTIRLALYSKRFLIKTMQLVGATSGFIRRPFVVQSLFQGIFAAIFGMALLMAIVQLTNQFLLDISDLLDYIILLQVFAAIIVMGIFISVVSTWLALNKYLRMKLDDLY